MPPSHPSRTELHRQFVEKFDQQYHPRTPIAPTQIQQVEKELGIVLPKAYTQFLDHYGGISTSINITLGYNGPYHPCLEGFTIFNHVLEVVRLGWRTIIPAPIAGAATDINGNVFDFLFPFAEAECGNYFCFARSATVMDDLPVYLFDHDPPTADSPNVELIAQSFDDLLWWYIEHLVGRA